MALNKLGISVAMVGNPNSGKSSIFNLLTGMRQQVSNFPGVTVDKKIGQCILSDGKKINILDLPGIYSLYPNSADEKLVVNILSNPLDPNHPDFIIYLADVNNLERHILLATQIADLKIPMVIVLTMSDIFLGNGNVIDLAALNKYIEVPVILASGRTGENIDEIKLHIEKYCSGQQAAYLTNKDFYKFSDEETVVSRQVMDALKVNSLYRAKLWAHHHSWLPHIHRSQKEQIKTIAEEYKFQNLRQQVDETLTRFSNLGKVIKETLITTKVKQSNSTDRIDAILTHRIFGPFIFFSIMLLVFQAIFSVAEYPMQWIEYGFGNLGEQARVMLPNGWISDLVVDGIIAGLAGVLVFIPQITILFLLITSLEELGYMSRAVFLFDGLMQRFGLNGRSIVALVSSGACAIPAIMSTRTISNLKERLITIMVAPLISCSARIPVYTVLVGFVVPKFTVFGVFNSQGLVFMALYIISIVAALVAAYVFKRILKTSEPSFLLIELPQYKSPIIKNVLLTVKEKVLSFIFSAGKIIMVISVALWFLASYGPTKAMEAAEKEARIEQKTNSLDDEAYDNLLASKKIESSYAGHIGKLIEPAIRPLGFDWKIGIALITSFAAREVFVGTMGTIYSIGSSNDEGSVREKMSKEMRAGSSIKMYDVATAMSLLLFYVFAMQCMSTLAVTKRETNSWKWPIIQLVYMTILAYVASFTAYNLLS